MNILQIDSENGWRGGQQQVLYLASGLEEKGHNVFLICPQESPLENKAKEAEINVIPMKMRNELDFLAIRKIKKIIKENGIQICHLHSSTAHSLGVIAARKIPECRTIFTRRVDFYIRRNFFTKMKYGKVSQIIAISKRVKDVLIGNGILDKKIDVVYSACDWKRFQNVDGKYLFSDLNLDERKSIVGIVAAFAWHKDYENFLRTAKIVKDKFSQIQFLVTGEGKERQKIERLIRKLKLEKDVKLLGFRKDIPQILSILNVFVLSSSWEGLGSSTLDAMASHLPVVATRAGGIPEIVEEGKSGNLVPPKDPESLAGAIIDLLKNPARAKKMGEEGFQVVKEKFSVEKMVDETEKIYKGLI